MESLDGLGLKLTSRKATLELSADQTRSLAQAGMETDITIQQGDQRKVAQEMAGISTAQGAKIIGEPVEITAGVKGNTKVTLPLQGLDLPNDQAARQKLLDSLSVLVLHSDGDKQVVEGTVIFGEQDKPTSIEFIVDKFSTFAVIQQKAVILEDISGHWAESSMLQVTALGAITGYPDGSFRPNNKITRAEFVTVLVKALDLDAQGDKVFADSADHWAKEYISTAASLGIVEGYSSSQFGPNDLITREQMAVMITRAAGLEGSKAALTFADSDQISHWAQQAVTAALANKVITGYPDGSFKPKGNASRAEAVTIIARTL